MCLPFITYRGNVELPTAIHLLFIGFGLTKYDCFSMYDQKPAFVHLYLKSRTHFMKTSTNRVP